MRRLAARILVVDDQRANAEMLAEALARARLRGLDRQQRRGRAGAHRHGAARHGHLRHPDAEVDGYELCRRLRAQPPTALLPVILVTSLDAHAERVRGLEAGADDFSPSRSTGRSSSRGCGRCCA
jgi:two-component system cell cycle response regulator